MNFDKSFYQLRKIRRTQLWQIRLSEQNSKQAVSGWLSDKERQTLDLKLMKNMFVKPDFVVNKIITLQTLWTSSRRGTPFPKTQRHPLNHISKVFNFLTLVIMIHNFICQVQGQLRPLLTKEHQGPNSTILYWPTDQCQPLLTQYHHVLSQHPAYFFWHGLSNHFITHSWANWI